MYRKSTVGVDKYFPYLDQLAWFVKRVKVRDTLSFAQLQYYLAKPTASYLLQNQLQLMYIRNANYLFDLK